MNLKKTLLCTVLAAALAPLAAQADPYQIEIKGTIDFNVIRGDLTGVTGGTPVTMDFTVDSSNFLNSASYPTRSYVIDPASFSLQIGNAIITMPTSGASPSYFVLRNNDPRVDGVFISTSVDTVFESTVVDSGGALLNQMDFLHTFSGGGNGQADPTFQSLNIADAAGSYNLTQNVSDFLWGLGTNGTHGAEIIPTSMTITAVPEPESYALMLAGLSAVGFVARRRKNLGQL